MAQSRSLCCGGAWNVQGTSRHCFRYTGDHVKIWKTQNLHQCRSEEFFFMSELLGSRCVAMYLWNYLDMRMYRISAGMNAQQRCNTAAEKVKYSTNRMHYMSVETCFQESSEHIQCRLVSLRITGS